MVHRILPVASGKGGVGKTTFAVNFALALSRLAPTVLIDLDTGTSSVRATLPVPISHDLYHFYRKRRPLADCISRLDAERDPRGQFKNFGLIASPRHYIEELSRLSVPERKHLAAEIHRLPARYVVLDLKAGLDESVLGFLPYTNSGILVFTPHHPAATFAAAEIVKAILFRSLRFLFARGSGFFDQVGMDRYFNFIHELLDRVEDVYDETYPNLDAFVAELGEALGPHPILEVIVETLEAFRVHYVLNMFNGVEQSFEGTIAPFVRSLSEHVSGRLKLSQLGWIAYDEKVQQANASGFPLVLDREQKPPPPPPVDRVAAELAAIEQAFLSPRKPAATPRPRGREGPPGATRPPLDPQVVEDVLDGQLRALRALYDTGREETVRENFNYLVYRVMSLLGPDRSPAELGQTVLASPEQLTAWYLARQRG